MKLKVGGGRRYTDGQFVHHCGCPHYVMLRRGSKVEIRCARDNELATTVPLEIDPPTLTVLK